MNVEQAIREYLTSGKTHMMQLATSDGDQPWCCTVYFAVDDELNIIWLSKPSRRHSQEIAKNSKVAAAIAYDQQPPQPFVQGIQVEGVAEQLSDEEATKAIHIYAGQLKSDPNWVRDVINGKDPHVAYRIKPSRIVLFDTKAFPEEQSQELKLES
jgi:uncharacterized protein YhbP (UPF0306 family)